MDIAPLTNFRSFRCPLHPSHVIDGLNLSPSAANHRVCFLCAINGSVPAFALADLESIFQAVDSESCILCNYPPLATMQQRLESIQKFSTSKMIELIEQQIGCLKRTFDEILEQFKNDSIRSVEELGQQRRQVIDLYWSLIEPNKLKEAVMEVSETKLHELIVGKYQNSYINTSKLQAVISQFEDNQEKFSLKLANKSTQTLQYAMRNLSFFTSPITPLIFKKPILQELQLVPSNYAGSASRAEIARKENYHLNVKCIQDNGFVCELFSSNALDNNAHYTFRFAFHQEATEGTPQFVIGLINQEHKDTTTDYNLFRYEESSQYCEINKIIKGVALNSTFDAKNVHKEVEMRVHLASQTVKVADFPNYNNVVELADKTMIREGCQYCLLVQLRFLNDHITLTDVAVSDRFDSSM